MLTALSLKILSLVQTETAGKLKPVFEISLWSYIHGHKPAFIFSRTDSVDADFNLFILTQWWPQTMCYDQMVSFSFIYLLIILTQDVGIFLLFRAPTDNRYTFKYSEGITLVK